jgi:hypothetical protein
MHCFKYLKGACDAGDSCRWAHLTSEEVEAKRAQPKAKAASTAAAETTPNVAMPCLIWDQEDQDDDICIFAGVCAEFCAVSTDDDDDKTIIGRKHPKSRFTAFRNLLMPDEFTDMRTKDQLEEQRKADVGEDIVPAKVPLVFFSSKNFRLRSELAREMALRKAELLCDSLRVEKYEDEYIVEDYKGQVYQILVNHDDGIEFLSSTDLPPCVYQDYSDSVDETPQSLEKEVEPTKTKDRLSSDYWILKEDGLLIRKHVVPRTNLSDPDFNHYPFKNLKIKEMRITHVQYLTGKSDIVCDQWAQPSDNQVMKKWVGQTIFFVDKSIPKIKDSVCMSSENVPAMPEGKRLLDTGCGHDLISRKMVGNGPVRQLDDDEVIAFATANGKIATDVVAPMFCEELKDMMEPLVLPDTPAVLSIGRRCMQMGYGFYWHPGQNPFLVTPDGSVIPLLVRKDIPYLAVGASR